VTTQPSVTGVALRLQIANRDYGRGRGGGDRYGQDMGKMGKARTWNGQRQGRGVEVEQLLVDKASYG